MDRQEVLVPTKVGESQGWSDVRTLEIVEIQLRAGRFGSEDAKADRRGILQTERVEPDDVLEGLDGAF